MRTNFGHYFSMSITSKSWGIHLYKQSCKSSRAFRVEAWQYVVLALCFRCYKSVIKITLQHWTTISLKHQHDYHCIITITAFIQLLQLSAISTGSFVSTDFELYLIFTAFERQHYVFWNLTKLSSFFGPSFGFKSLFGFGPVLVGPFTTLLISRYSVIFEYLIIVVYNVLYVH